MNAAQDFMAGQKFFLNGHYRKSIISFAAALEHGFSPEKGYLALGMAHLKNGDFVEAVDDFSHVLTYEHDKEQAYFYRGIAHLNHADLEESVTDLGKVLDHHPDRTDALVARSLAYRHLGREQEAEVDMRRALFSSGLEVEEFMRNYVISPQLYRWALELFDVQDEAWAVELGRELRQTWH